MSEPNQYTGSYGAFGGGDPRSHRTAARFEPGPGYGREYPGPGYGGERDSPGPPDVEVLDRSWDFEAELAQLLRDSGPDAAAPQGGPAEPLWHSEEQRPEDRYPDEWHPGDGAPEGPDDEAPLERPLRHRHRRRQRRRSPRPEMVWVHLISFTIAAMTATIVAMVSVLGGLVSYNPLRHLVGPHVSAGLAQWWPLLVYGPWLAASLSILRATLLRRRARHSWLVVVLFSAIAVVLCIGQAPRTLSGLAAASLPPITALACFHQLVSQITLTRPRHALPRDCSGLPRQRTASHRRTEQREAGRD